MDRYEFEASLADRDQGQPGLQKEILSQKKKNNENQLYSFFKKDVFISSLLNSER